MKGLRNEGTPCNASDFLKNNYHNFFTVCAVAFLSPDNLSESECTFAMQCLACGTQPSEAGFG